MDTWLGAWEKEGEGASRKEMISVSYSPFCHGTLLLSPKLMQIMIHTFLLLAYIKLGACACTVFGRKV